MHFKIDYERSASETLKSPAEVRREKRAANAKPEISIAGRSRDQVL